MAVVSMKQLLESGVHFGHQTRRWNPKMAPYIFTSRKDIHIIDLKRTAIEIEKAYEAMYDIAKDGGRVLFVGTKKQAQEAIKEEAIRAGQFYVDHRWLGGTLTNFKTIRRRIKLLHDLYEAEANGTWDKLPKKEVLGLTRQRTKLERFLGGIKDMQRLPQAIFVVDPRTEEIAVLEARKLGIPVFGIVDTNCDPDLVDYIIPANDDAIRAVKLLTWVMANAVVEAKGGVVEKYEDEEEAPFEQNDSRKSSPKPRQPRPDQRPSTDKVTPKAEAKPEVKPEVKAEVKVAEKAAPAKETEKPSEDLSALKVAELKELAKTKGIENYSKLKKAELIEALSK